MPDKMGQKSCAGFIALWIFVSLVVLSLNAWNYRWQLIFATNNRLYFVQVVVVAIYHSVLLIEICHPVCVTIITLIHGGRPAREKTARTGKTSVIINYNLLATCTKDIDDTFAHMHQAFMDNLSLHVSAVLVSATDDADLSQHERNCLTTTRQHIFNTLLKEGEKHGGSFWFIINE